jgi:mRNA deadenylase 3'-5' endonuclease subunit Ccr4
MTTTHLFWECDGAYIRLKQLNILFNEIEKINGDNQYPIFLAGDFNCSQDSFIYKYYFGGLKFGDDDFNKEFGQFEIEKYYDKKYQNYILNDILNNFIKYDNDNYNNNKNNNNNDDNNNNINKIKNDDKEEFNNNKNEYKNKMIHFKSLKSSYSDYQKYSNTKSNKSKFEAPYTHYTNDYNATLDYIFYNPKKFLLLKILQIPENVFPIPNETFSSDHFCLVSEFSFL